MKRRTSRILNDNSVLLGLSYTDITTVGCFLLGLLVLEKTFRLDGQLWALLISLSLLFALIPIRLKYRKKMIRDLTHYTLKQGAIRVSKNTRK